MATIVDAYDLSGGDTLSLEVVNPVNLRIQCEVTGSTQPTQAIYLTMQTDDGTAYVNLNDSIGDVIKYGISGNSKISKNHYGINSVSLKVKVEAENADGLLTITTHES
jgi:hypothetical protein